MENAVVNLLICGCILFTKASHLYNCSGCSSNGRSGSYKCNPCYKFNHSVTCDVRDPSDCLDCMINCPLCTTVCITSKTQTPVTTSTIPSKNIIAYKVVEKQNIEECPSGNIAGSVVGGALFGSLLTVLIFMLHRHRQKKSIRNPVQNPSYQTEMMRINERGLEEDIGKSMYSEINDERSNKESRVPPIWKNGNIHENKDGVYNTLNEANIMDRSEYYDHTRPGASFSTPADGYGTVTLEYDQARIDASVSKPSDGYGTVTLENGGNDTHPKDKSVVEKDIISSQEDKTDEYFVLEKIQ